MFHPGSLSLRGLAGLVVLQHDEDNRSLEALCYSMLRRGSLSGQRLLFLGKQVPFGEKTACNSGYAGEWRIIEIELKGGC